MTKLEISILIPAVKPLEDCPLIMAFLNSGLSESIYPQFVYLYNPKQATNAPSEIQTDELFEVIHVTTDRYFSSCEENIYRVQDFADLLKSDVFIIGEHDQVDWEALGEALVMKHTQGLEIVAWNVLYNQLKSDGSYSSLLGVDAVPEGGAAQVYLQHLQAGLPLESDIGLATLISLFGPLDWGGFIGNHLWSKDAFIRSMRYKFAEHIYSYAFKQLLFCSRHRVRYGFLNRPVILKMNDEHLRKRQGNPIKHWWFEEHRTIHGNSKAFWMAAVMHLLQIEDDSLFHLIVNSLVLAQMAGIDEEQIQQRYALLSLIFSWSTEAMAYKLTGKSFYFPEVTNGSLQDSFYVHRFFTRLQGAFETHPEIYDALSGEFKALLQQAQALLGDYLRDTHATDAQLAAALSAYSAAQAALTVPAIVHMNDAAFTQYVRQRRG